MFNVTSEVIIDNVLNNNNKVFFDKGVLAVKLPDNKHYLDAVEEVDLLVAMYKEEALQLN